MSAKGVRKVCVIGAGVSGLAAMKELKEVGITDIVCFEQYDQIGGMWYYSEKTRPNQGTCAYKTLVTNSSKEMMVYSDFPFPKDYPPYLPWDLYQQYLNNYCDHFKLRDHIHFNTTILSVKENSDYATTARWQVRTRGKNGHDEEHIFDNVLVCTGFCQKPFTPKVAGMENFRGKLIHMHEYRDPNVFDGKRVMIVGNANSAGDVAADASYRAAQTYLSVGDGTWVLTRVGKNGLPRDFLFRRAIINYLPIGVASRILKADCNRRFDHVNYGMASEKAPFKGSAVMVNDDISHQLISGKIKAVATISRFTETGVELEDGKKISDLDIVVYATGYKHHFNFLDRRIMPDEDKELATYKMVFPVELKHDSLAFIGAFSNIGAHAPAIELQARWVAQVLAGKHKLPPRDVMRADVQKLKDELIRTYGKVKYKMAALPYREELATELGVRPDFWKVFMKSPKVAFQTVFGPAFPVHYRLIGPGARDSAWTGAEVAWQNTVTSTRTRDCTKISKQDQQSLFIKFTILLMLVAFVISVM